MCECVCLWESLCVSVCVYIEWVCIQSATVCTCMDVRGHLGVGSLLLPCGCWGLNAGCQAWQQASLPVEQPPAPDSFIHEEKWTTTKLWILQAFIGAIGRFGTGFCSPWFSSMGPWGGVWEMQGAGTMKIQIRWWPQKVGGLKAKGWEKEKKKTLNSS